MNIMGSSPEPESTITNVDLDHTGKAMLDDIYSQADPRLYFQTLRPLDYSIPGYAHPYFSALVNRLSEIRKGGQVRAIDLGCSYGINSALLKLGLSYERLVDNYADAEFENLSRKELIERDRGLIAERAGTSPHMTGVDISQPALEYGIDAGYLDEAILADLESNDLSAANRRHLVGTDLVISTGCIGYVGAETIRRLLEGMGDARPWSAHFVLRMFAFDEIAAVFSERGYETIPLPGLFKQRKFVSSEERNEVTATLNEQGFDTSGLEETGYFFAQMHLTIPDEDMDSARDLISAWRRVSMA